MSDRTVYYYSMLSIILGQVSKVLASLST